jgi:hypothetical protein
LYYYRLQTIRLAHEVLRFGTEEEMITDEMIMVGLIMLYYTISTSICWKEYEAHLRGIEQMVAARGGVSELNAVVAEWLERVYGPWTRGFEYGHFGDAVLADLMQKLCDDPNHHC